MIGLPDVRGFWERHVNNEYYTAHARGTREYFADIEHRRYRHHYHLSELFARIGALPNVGGLRLAEIGCGIGIDTLSLARLGFASVVGIDLTSAALQVARRRAAENGASNVEFVCGDAENLAFPDATFDVVYSFGVIHHTPLVQRAVAEIERVLRPGGRAFVMIYHAHSLVNLVHRALRLPFESPRHLADHCPVVYRFSRTGGRRLFSSFATTVVRADYPFTYGMRWVSWPFPVAARRLLGRVIGWHLMIEATKG